MPMYFTFSGDTNWMEILQWLLHIIRCVSCLLQYKMADATDEQATNTLKGDECVTDTQADAIEDTCVEDHEGYELEDLKAVVYDIIWNIVVERRALLRNLISAKRFIDYPPPQPKASYKHAQEPVPDGNELMDSAIDSILDVDEELRNVDKEIIREQVLRICG